jgi:ribosome-associated protein
MCKFNFIMKYIELNTFLKIKGIAVTGGQAKILIQSGEVKVNGNIEKRNKNKLRAGDKVSVNNENYAVEKEVCLKE